MTTSRTISAMSCAAIYGKRSEQRKKYLKRKGEKLWYVIELFIAKTASRWPFGKMMLNLLIGALKVCEMLGTLSMCGSIQTQAHDQQIFKCFPQGRRTMRRRCKSGRARKGAGAHGKNKTHGGDKK